MHVEEHLRKTFDAWVVDSTHPDTIPGPIEDAPAPGNAADRRPPTHGGSAEEWSVSTLLYRLWDSTDTMPVVVSMALNLPPAATYGHAAQLLWWLRTGDRFVCTSYAQAVDFLQRLDDTTFKQLYQRVTDYLRENDRSRSRGPAPATYPATGTGSAAGRPPRRARPTRQSA